MATNTTVTRRSLVGACLAGTAGLLASAPTARAAEAERTWDAECDVLIVGSGYTGLAAAIEAGRDFIMQSVLATSFARGAAPEGAVSQEWDLNGKKAVLSVRRA